jgi:beta-lactamase regulating signal transducer with metallopeptidase domain
MDGITPSFVVIRDLLEDGMRLAVDAGACAGLVAIVVLVINVLFRRWLTAGQMGLLWSLVLLRLLLPTAPSSPLSWQNLLVTSIENTAESRAAQLAVRVDSQMANNLQPRDLQQLAVQPTPALSTSTDWAECVLAALPFVWFVVGAVGLIRTVANYWLFCRAVCRTPECDDARLVQLWAQCCGIASVRREIPMRLFDGVEQPAVMGLWKPILLLPSDSAELADEQLRMIMLHELAHVRRWDIAINWVLVVLRAIHWWNPVYWLTAARFRRLREQACDAFVIERIEGRPGQEYSELLLSLAERSASRWRVMLPSSILGFFPSIKRGQAVRSRLRALRSVEKKQTVWQTAAFGGVALAVMVGGLTNARTLEPTPAKVAQAYANMRNATIDVQKMFSAVEVYDGPLVLRRYDDIEQVIERIADTERKSIGDAKQMFEHLLTLTLRNARIAAKSDGQNLVNAASDTTEPQVTFAIDGNTLEVNAPVAVHEKLGRTLDAWRETGLGQICVQLRVVTADRDIASEVGIAWQYVEAFSPKRPQELTTNANESGPIVRATTRAEDYLPVAVATLNNSQSAALTNLAQRDVRANVLQAPKVTTFNGQEGFVADCSQRPFVVGVQLHGGEERPKIVVIDEGSKIKWCGVHGPERSKIRLRANVEFSSVREV